ncbi:hypothetical protein [Yinghuangia sp. YIM S10712]|uniref:hypothetical protein n=1 Tax=Yinghuangia sp. YIM S10712 TaxID=3436930 RepID=UPI003F52C8EC
MKAEFLRWYLASGGVGNQGPDELEDGVPRKPPGGIGDGVTKLLDWSTWIVMMICGIAVLVAAARMAMAHKSGAEGGQHVIGLAWIIAAAILIGSGAALIREFV